MLFGGKRFRGQNGAEMAWSAYNKNYHWYIAASNSPNPYGKKAGKCQAVSSRQYIEGRH